MARATKLRVVGGKTSVYVNPRRPKHALEVGAPCPNCGTALAGPWCYACGQKGEEFHRSVWHLVAEAFEGLTHFDGRLGQTLPRLVYKPGHLTRDYLDGHRAPQVPPFRMFLVVLLIVFFAGAWNFNANKVTFRVEPIQAASMIAKDPEQAANIRKLTDWMNASVTGRWVNAHGEAAMKNPEAFLSAVEQWSHQFAILLLPISALILSALFAFKRGVYVFDHLIFSMHSLSFQGLLLSASFLGGVVTPAASQLLWAAPVHLFFHMRYTYRIGVFGTLWRMVLLLVGSTAAFLLLLSGLFFVGLATLH